MKPRLSANPLATQGEAALLAFPGHIGEAKGIAQIVHNLITAERVEPNDILILLRSDHHRVFSRPIRQELERMAVVTSDTQTVVETLNESSNRKILETARILVNHKDSIAWTGILKLEEGIGEAFFDAIYQTARDRACTFGEALLFSYERGFPGVRANIASKVKRVMEILVTWMESITVPENRPESGWGTWLLSQVNGGILAAPTETFISLLHEIDALEEAGETLGRYLSQIEPLGRDIAAATSNGVRIMSMTSSKGLTVRATIIAALEDGICPMPDLDRSEERRLLYVGMTRAKEYLYCTWARRRTGPTARSGMPRIRERRSSSSFLDGGPIESQDGDRYLKIRWGGE
jgi:DNA helicase-2/ATP-dependent DNA helicase PcrA